MFLDTWCRFIPSGFRTISADVLIIGGGIAGLRAAMEIDPRLSLLVITKDTMEQSNSAYAQGGIASVIDPEDNFASHVDDTLDRRRQLVRSRSRRDGRPRGAAAYSATDRVGHELRHGAGRAACWAAKEGIAIAASCTRWATRPASKSCGRSSSACATQHDAQIWPNTFTIDLLTHEGRCRGALVWHAQHGRTFVWAKQTILCTGGAGQIYRETTNPEVATGDGHALAYRAGAELRDMEFMQFHPTVLYIAGGSRSLITEAMRGEGARLIDATGRRFMPDYDERAELAPRDVVSQAIVAQMEKTRQPSVFLDMSHLDADRVRKRFPGIARTCAEFGIDIATDPIPVRPGAHYMIGGVTVDHEGRTTVPGLVGGGRSDEQRAARRESTGVEQFAGRTGVRRACRRGAIGSGAAKNAIRFTRFRLENAPVEPHTEPLDLADIRNSLKSLMWRAAGVRRVGAAAGRCGANDSPLVRLRAGAAVERPGRLGAAEHAHRGEPDGRGGTGAGGVARRASSHRLSPDGRRALAAASGVRASQHRAVFDGKIGPFVEPAGLSRRSVV